MPNLDELLGSESPQSGVDLDQLLNQSAKESPPEGGVDLDQLIKPKAAPELPYPEMGVITPQEQPNTESPGILAQILQIPKDIREIGAETGLKTAGGFESQRARAISRGAAGPVALEGRLVGMKGMSPEERIATAIDRSNALSAQRAAESSQQFLEAASTAPEDYGLDPKLKTGLITQATRGLAKGAGMYAMAAAGGIPVLALQGSTEAYGSAKQAGKSDDEADKESTRAMIALAIFGGANKAVSSGIARYLGNASKLRTFLVQTLGQAAGNEVTSRAISAYEAALDAEPGKRADAAVEALTRNDPGSIAQNLGFALMGGSDATRQAIVKERGDNLRLEEVYAENIQREKAQRDREAQLIAEQNAQAARLGEQRQAQGVPAGPEVAPEAISPEIKARSEQPTEPGISAPITAPPQKKEEVTVNYNQESGTVTTPEGTFVVDESGATPVVPESPKDISMKALGTELPKPPEGEPNAIQEQSANASVLRPETPGQEGVGLREVGKGNAVAEAPPEAPKVKLAPFEPQTTGEQIISTGILGEDGVPIPGPEWNSGHAKIINANKELALLEDVDARKGFIVQDADGNQRFVGRKEALEIARKSGQVDEAQIRSATAEGLISEALKAAPKPAEAESTVPASETAPEPPPPSPPPEAPTPESAGAPKGPVEFPTGIRFTVVERNRIAQGLPPLDPVMRKQFGSEWEKAKALDAQNPDAGSELIDSLAKNPRAPKPEELALLTLEQAVRENAYNEALDAVNNAPDAESMRIAEDKLDRASERNRQAYEVGRRAGTESGQSLAFRKMMTNKDYSLARMESELLAMSRRDKPHTPEEVKKIRKTAQESFEEIKKAEDRARTADEQQSRIHAEKELGKLMKGAEQEGRAAKKEGKTILDRIISSADEAQKRIRERNIKAASGGLRAQFLPFNPLDFPDHVLVGAGYIAKGIRGIAEFTKKFTDDFGPEAESSAPRVFEGATQYYNRANESVPKIRTVDQAMAKDKARERLDPNVVYEVVRAHVNAGVEGFDKVMAAATKSLQSNHPDVTMREVRDAFSGYGKVTRPSQEADKMKVAEYKRLAQIASGIEDAMKGIPPKKTGFQRPEPTEEIRSQMRKLKQALEENGIQVTSPEQQLANAQQATTTRLKNSIESLERQIATKTRDSVSRGKTVETPEIKALRDRVESLRETLDQVAPRAEATDAQKIDRSIASVEKRISELDEQLKTGATKAAKPAGPTSPKLERLRAERDAMNRLVSDLRNAAKTGKTPEAKKLDAALKSVDRQIAELDRQLQTGDIGTPTKGPSVTSPTLEARRAERDAMTALRRELRGLSKPKMTPEQRTIRALEKSIAELDRQLKGGDKRTAAAKGPESTAVEALRSERDAMAAALKEIRESAKSKRTPEEIALSRYKKTLVNKTKALEKRIKNNDYVKRPRKETALDKEALDARFEYQKAKDRYEQKVFEYDLGRRSALKRVYDTALETLNLSRAIMTSFDVSAPLRQGAFLTLAHPIRSLKSFPSMFKAFASAREEFRVQESLSDPSQRPNAALYRQAGLDLSESPSTGTAVSRRKLEEMYQTRFAKKIPIVAGSERAYTTFLNLMRADSFDSLVKNLSKNGKTVTDAEAKAIAKFVNIATGRGQLGEKLERATEALNLAFFAPKYVASRFQLLLNPATGFRLTGGSARVRSQVAKEYARFLIGAGTVIGLAQLGGATVSKDPEDPDFGKIKIGNTRIDPFGGLSQTARFIADTGKTANIVRKEEFGRGASKQERQFRAKFPDRIFKFARTKFSPALGAGFDIGTGKTVTGQPTTVAGSLGKMAVPMTFGDLIDALEEQGVPRGTALWLASAFGASMSTYETKGVHQRRPAQQSEQPWKTVPRQIENIIEHPMGKGK